MSIALVEHNDGYVLIKDGTMLSYVNPKDPTDLGFLFPYMRLIADEIDALPEGPLRVVHIGGGAMTLTRYIEHTRPYSSQVVVEPDQDILDVVEEGLPVMRNTLFTLPIKGEDYLRVTKSLNEDLVIMDAFDGFNTPEPLTTLDCFENVKRVLKPGGTMISNVIHDWQLYADRVARLFDEMQLLGDGDVLAGERTGNVIVVAR